LATAITGIDRTPPVLAGGFDRPDAAAGEAAANRFGYCERPMPTESPAATPPTSPAAAASAPGAAFAAQGSSRQVLVLVAHPQMELSRANRGLMNAAARLPPAGEAGAVVRVRDLYALYPDYVIDVDRERAALLEADLVVWQHPIHWYGPTPLLKLWMDDVLGFGWAYGPGGTALQGKDLWVVLTTGGPEPSYQPDGYNRYPFDTFLPPYEQTAALCGMRFLPPLVIHGAHRLSVNDIEARAEAYAQRLRAYPGWPELTNTSATERRVPNVPSDARRAGVVEIPAFPRTTAGPEATTPARG
jgi:glutathione-regulated potassium-efflux system ancillary protein KefF